MDNQNHATGTLVKDKPTELAPVVAAEKEPENVAADIKNYKLCYPVEWNGEDVESVTMRRPVLRDKIAAEKQVDDNDSMDMVVLMLSFVLNTDPEFMHELDEEFDFAKLIKLFNQFRDEPIIDDNTLTLKYPLMLKGKKIETLTMRRPTLRDSQEFKDQTMDEKIARLCGHKRSDFLDLDLKTDWYGLTEIYNSFRKKRSKYSVA